VVKPDSPTIAQSVEKFLASIGKRNLSAETVRKYRYLLETRLLDWCKAKGYKLLKELGTEQMDDFRGTWTTAPTTRQKISNGSGPISGSVAPDIGSS
jgi:hypothetical protein